MSVHDRPEWIPATLGAGVAILVALLALSGCSSTITIHSHPEGARVIVDGAELGRTPITFRAPASSKIALELEGYWRKEVELTDKRTAFLGGYPYHVNASLAPVGR